MYYPFETQISPLTRIHRERMLPNRGEVLVNIGERVEPTQVVARTKLPGDFRIVPVARILDIPASQAEDHLQIEIGDKVRRNQVIAKQRGPLSRSVRAPISGVVTASGGGRILIEDKPALFELRAYIPGKVSNALRGLGIVIEVTGALVQGAWGSGGENLGVLRSLVESPDQPLQAEMIDPSCHGTVIIGGATLDIDVIERAQEVQVRGIVTGGLPPEQIPDIEGLPFPIVVTEGIGEIPMSALAFQLLTTNVGREVSISGKTQPRNDKHLGMSFIPEVIIPLPGEKVPEDQKQPGTPLEVGTLVRAVRAPHIGTVGIITALPTHARRIETGARVRCAEVDLGQGQTASIPLANLEALR
jgi:hypothetical protein